MSFDFKNVDVRDVGRAEGNAYIKGLGVGMSEGSYNAITAVENVYVELESLTKNAAKNAEKLEKKRQERKLDNLKNSLKLELICEQEYYEQLKAFRDKNLRQGTDAWYKCTEEIAAYNHRVLKEAEEYNQRMLEEAQRQYDKLIAMREELAKKLIGSEPWASRSKITFKGMGENGTDLIYTDTELENFREEILLLEEWHRKLVELKNLGDVPQGVFSDIASMSVKSGIDALDAILAADEKTRGDFFAGFSRREALADSISADALDLLYEEKLQKAGLLPSAEITAKKGAVQADFAEMLKASFDEVPESYYTLGEDAGDAFGVGFVSRIPQLMEQVQSAFVSAINMLGSQLSLSLRQIVQGATQGVSNTYHNTYTFNASKDTTTQQLNAARNAATLERLRGGSN